MKLVEELEVKDTSCGYLPPYRPLVVTYTIPSLSNDYVLSDVIIGVQNSQGLTMYVKWPSNGKRIGCILSN
jgi:hypothetical protein